VQVAGLPGGVRYSVPHALVEAVERVWVREGGDEVIVTVVDQTGPREVARHPRGQRGQAVLCEAHYPQRTRPAGERTPAGPGRRRAGVLGHRDGARAWLVEAATAGAARVRGKLAEAVTLAKLHGTSAVDQALGAAALAGRFGDGDLLAILAHQRVGVAVEPTRASEAPSLQPGTRVWVQPCDILADSPSAISAHTTSGFTYPSAPRTQKARSIGRGSWWMRCCVEDEGCGPSESPVRGEASNRLMLRRLKAVRGER
jgi:hypothetical protein